MADYNLHQTVSFEMNLTFKIQYRMYGDSGVIELIIYKAKEATVTS